MMGDVFYQSIKNVLIFIFTGILIIGILVVIFVFGKEFIKQKIAQAISNMIPI